MVPGLSGRIQVLLLAIVTLHILRAPQTMPSSSFISLAERNISMKRTLQFAAVFVLGVLTSLPSFALPRFASRTGAKCLSCHINPSGGGMRQTFGVQYGRETLPVPTWSDELGLDDFSTRLTDFVSIGADFRTLYFYQQNPDTGVAPPPEKATNAFFQMQGDIYMNFRLAKKVNISRSRR